jgi:hypothetical protein
MDRVKGFGSWFFEKHILFESVRRRNLICRAGQVYPVVSSMRHEQQIKSWTYSTD